MKLLEVRVPPEWVDYNGHMNDAEYARAFSLAVDTLMEQLGLDAEGRERLAYTLYTLETHLCYHREVLQNQALSVEALRLDHDAKRLHAFFSMRDDQGELLATSEQMLMGIDTRSRRPAPFPPEVAEAIAALPQAEADAWPSAAGRRIGIPQK
ncbi:MULTISPECIES: thioesterase family protein [Halomonas]|uniref:L-carnitine dehydrogenase n=1 Tax=Halomonas chromatireducens TaxID=507626 RepID=A0A0X8HDT8_9GAMM|nr:MULTISPECIES: thioesterase family protein [Halomonas]AMD00813.1 L-carnitine dehydrogenase [Halomonas chromatireducens]MBZ0330870.1 thioesterase family protein [Halomonas sp. ANAO-440]